MDGGLLNANFQYIGSTGLGKFTQTGGTNNATCLEIGATGSYTLSGGILNINGSLKNNGVWDLSNSSAVINASSSIVNLSNALPTNAGTASINLDSHSLLIMPTGHDPGEYFSSINSAGIIHQAGSTLDIPSAYSICGIGSIDDHVTCEGTLTSPLKMPSISIMD